MRNGCSRNAESQTRRICIRFEAIDSAEDKHLKRRGLKVEREREREEEEYGDLERGTSLTRSSVASGGGALGWDMDETGLHFAVWRWTRP